MSEGIIHFEHYSFSRGDESHISQTIWSQNPKRRNNNYDTREVARYLIKTCSSSPVRAAIFDAGGVLHAFNKDSMVRNLAEYIGDDEATTQIWEDLIPELAAGKIDEEKFWELARDSYGIREVNIDEDVLGRSLMDNYHPIRYSLRLMKEIAKKGIALALLTNTVESHARKLEEKGLYRPFDEQFLSYKIGYRKPDRAAFSFVMDSLGLEPQETIFIDDMRDNVDVARDIGITAYKFSWGMGTAYETDRHKGYI